MYREFTSIGRVWYSTHWQSQTVLFFSLSIFLMVLSLWPQFFGKQKFFFLTHERLELTLFCINMPFGGIENPAKIYSSAPQKNLYWHWMKWLLTSFHLRSDSGSATKSKRTWHCLIFWMKSSSLADWEVTSFRAFSLVNSRFELKSKHFEIFEIF